MFKLLSSQADFHLDLLEGKASFPIAYYLLNTPPAQSPIKKIYFNATPQSPRLNSKFFQLNRYVSTEATELSFDTLYSLYQKIPNFNTAFLQLSVGIPTSSGSHYIGIRKLSDGTLESLDYALKNGSRTRYIFTSDSPHSFFECLYRYINQHYYFSYFRFICPPPQESSSWCPIQ